jgi:acyl-CoA dehydrogenase
LAALQSLDTEEENAWRLTALAKTKVGQVALLAAQEGVQMHGGMGMTDAFDIGLYLKRVRVAGELFGDESWHANRIADALSF